jgi:hypothetical protein
MPSLEYFVITLIEEEFQAYDEEEFQSQWEEFQRCPIEYVKERFNEFLQEHCSMSEMFLHCIYSSVDYDEVARELMEFER